MLLRMCACVLLFSACVDDTSSSTQAESGDHRAPLPPPPQQAFDACASLSAGDACAFDINGHHVEGTCRTGPDGGAALACAPDRPPPPPPPQQALDACASLAAGNACAFDIDGHHVDGVCRNGPDGTGPLACAPNQPPM